MACIVPCISSSGFLAAGSGYESETAMKRILCLLVLSLGLASSADNGRLVGLFYFLWLGEHGRKGPYDVTKILAADPDAGRKPSAPCWGGVGVYHHWGEPLYGYYFSNDEWVVRRHMKLIMQALQV